MTLRRYAPIAKSAGTQWPGAVRAEIERLDRRRCVCKRAGFPFEVIARCTGDLAPDHVRASHGMGMKSRSTVDNGALLSATCHRWKTEHGREARPLLLDWIARRESVCCPWCGHGIHETECRKAIPEWGPVQGQCQCPKSQP